MADKKTIAQQIRAKKTKQPPAFIYKVLGFIWKVLFKKKYGVHARFEYDFRKEKGPYILLSNHASRQDYIFVGVPLLYNRYNFVAGYNEFFRSHLAGVFDLLQVIPKKNFTPDVYTIKEVSRILKSGGKVVLFPEGMNSISGANQPVAIGTGKFIKHFKVPVYYSKIQGGYLTCPKYNLTDRYGHVDVTFGRLFTPEDIETLSPEKIENKINATLYHDDYAWNKEKGYVYKNDGKLAEGLETLLYTCPRCGKEFTMKSEGNKFWCEACGNGMTLKDTYEMVPLDESCILPETQTAWFELQRENAKQEVAKDGFKLTEKVKLGMLPAHEKLKDLKTSEIVGEGVLTLDKTGLTYDGTKNGEAFTFHLSTDEVPTYGMCTDISRFYTFYKGEFMEFYPENKTVEKWFLCTEEMHRFNGGKWKDFSWK